MTELAAFVADRVSRASREIIMSGEDALVDEQFREAARRFGAAESSERDQCRQLLTEADRRPLLYLGQRYALRAWKDRDPSLLSLTLAAHALEDFRGDPRDNQLELVLALWVARELGADESLFLRHADWFSEKGKVRLIDLMSGPAYLRELKTAGLAAVHEGGGLTFVPLVTTPIKRRPRKRPTQ